MNSGIQILSEENKLSSSFTYEFRDLNSLWRNLTFFFFYLWIQGFKFSMKKFNFIKLFFYLWIQGFKFSKKN